MLVRTLVHSTVLIAAAGSLAGCRTAKKPTVAIIPETTAQEVWESARAEGTRIASGWHWDTFWNGPSREDDLLRQIQIVDQQVDRGVAGIILAPDHAVALISPVRAAVAKSIPVAIINNPLAALPKGDVVFVLNDSAATGRMVAERIAPYLHTGKEEVAVLGVHPSFLGSLTLLDSMKAATLHDHPDVRFVEQRAVFGPSDATIASDDLVREHPGLRVIVALNVTQTRSAYDSLVRAGLARKVILIGCEQDFDVIHLLRTGDIDSVIARDTKTMVRDAMNWIQHRREGTATGETILVPPVLVTRENVDSPEIQRVLAVSGDQ